MILDYFIVLLGSYFGSDIMEYAIFPIMCVAFIVTVPGIIRAFWRR